MQSALALFSQPGAFGSFVGTKEQEKDRMMSKQLWEWNTDDADNADDHSKENEKIEPALEFCPE